MLTESDIHKAVGAVEILLRRLPEIIQECDRRGVDSCVKIILDGPGVPEGLQVWIEVHVEAVAEPQNPEHGG